MDLVRWPSLRVRLLTLQNQVVVSVQKCSWRVDMLTAGKHSSDLGIPRAIVEVAHPTIHGKSRAWRWDCCATSSILKCASPCVSSQVARSGWR
jgi:hypothetical protein